VNSRDARGVERLARHPLKLDPLLAGRVHDAFDLFVGPSPLIELDAMHPPNATTQSLPDDISALELLAPAVLRAIARIAATGTSSPTSPAVILTSHQAS
jgi:hypothetical protein